VIVGKGDLLKAGKALLSGIGQISQRIQDGRLERASPMVSAAESLNNVVELVFAFPSPNSWVVDKPLEVDTATVMRVAPERWKNSQVALE